MSYKADFILWKSGFIIPIPAEVRNEEERNMKIYKTKDYKEMSRKAANILSAQVILKPDCVLGLATGSTPIGTYDQLVEWYERVMSISLR